jgi:large subunit ribosomal protein L5
MNSMQRVRIEKVTLNIGAGKDQKVLEKGMILLKNITGIPPVKTFTSKRIPGWGLRPGLPIGCKLTLRGSKAVEVLKRLLQSKDNVLREDQVDEQGNVAFGIKEYIDIPDVKYDPEIGVMGLEVCITMEKPGYRIKRRRIMKRKIHRKHSVTKEETREFLKKNFNVKFGEGE